MDPNNPRSQRLQKVFYGIINGKDELTPYNASQFLEAICAHLDPATCVNKIMASKSGLLALQQAMWCKLNSQFFNTDAANLLAYLQAPDLMIINGGEFLNDIVLKIAYPPIFWDAFRHAFLGGSLNEKAQMSLGWLLQKLCCLPTDFSTAYRQHDDTKTILNSLLSSSSHPIRTIGHKIKHVLDTCMSLGSVDATIGPGPGGRHDNDFDDFRKISILPTADEIACMETSFLRPSDVLEDPETETTRISLHLDNQFRLLREDMLYEMREELQIVLGKKKGFHRGVKITDLYVQGIDCGAEGKRTKWGLVVLCQNDIPLLRNEQDVKSRKEYLVEHRNFLKHQSMACLIAGTEIIAFPTIVRDEDRLSKSPPEIVLQFDGEESTSKALRMLKTESNVTLIQIDTAIFSYEPILKRLQQAKSLPLSSELLLWKKGTAVSMTSSSCQATPIVEVLRADPQKDLRYLLGTSTSIKLDSSQATSLISGLTQQVSLLQGPPGTGKSFIGALLAKALHQYTNQTILVVCYTNHALDDILEGLLKIGIPEEDMLRLGGKSTAATEPLLVQNQKRVGSRTRDQWTIIDELKVRSETLYQQLQGAFNKYNNSRIHYSEISNLLEFEGPTFFEAFRVPKSDDGMTKVGRGGQKIQPFYLIDRWRHNQNAGVFADSMKDAEVQDIWKIPRNERQDLWRRWEEAILQEDIQKCCCMADEYNRIQDKLVRASNANMVNLLRSKRIVGCTTTAAAKYCEDIQAFNPDILLVEEAGEILESHILTSLGPETSQVVLIGDHKQLRPKVNNYLLTVEKGEGYDLNRSLFERLTLKDYPHQTLTEQHRMRPEISCLIRELTYPELVDAPSTHNRPDILGLQDNIVFIHHENLEDDNTSISDRRDASSTSSKHNAFEIDMILKIVKYLGQQGYGTNELVILTPYLGQLQKLRLALKKDNDPILNDLDSHDLVRAGLINPAEAKLTKKPIRLATIDNYQGEESDIVIISLTRSNPRFEIGFLFSPERLNVLLSRSRNGLIMIGNATTFKNARNLKGKELWTKLFDQLGHGKHIYDGLPVKCERHPDKALIVRLPEDFDVACPDGGCNAPCFSGIMLSCGVHPCPSKCHQLVDHSKMRCEEIIASPCPNGHPNSSACSDGPPKTCYKCERDLKLARKKQEDEMKAQQRREALQQEHLRTMDAINARIEELKRSQEDERLAKERENAIKQKQDDLAAMLSFQSCNTSSATTTQTTDPQLDVSAVKASSQSVPQAPSNVRADIAALDGCDPPQTSHGKSSLEEQPAPSHTTTASSGVRSSNVTGKAFPPLPTSLSKQEWQRQKGMQGLSNPAVDAIMDMTGLEDVKKQILEIMAKIETTTRQGASLKNERFNVVLLGNPGTGKTTVARHYAKFLASVKVTPADTFSETTGSRLAHEGVDGVKKLIDSIIKSGGGAIFVDEAYQLTSGHNSQGAAVLDFLLAEMENNVGTIVFILAGYNKEMEKFFEHNPGLKSRVPHQLQFADYKDEELMAIFQDLLIKTFQGRMKLEDGSQGLYSRIAVRRLGRRRGRPGFGNARDLQINFARIRGRQATRLAKIREQGGRADDFFMSGEDLIGPDPSKAIRESKAWDKLQNLIGLKMVKDSVTSLFNLISENYQRELLEREPMEISLNRVFLGSPGTGKTTVAKLYGQVLADLGLLSNGEVVVKNPSDFVGAVIGASEANTKAILANCVGKVLIIDEAYMLYGGGGDNSGGNSNQFKTSVIDTIVAEVQSVPGEDRCVLLLGYKDQMLEMFQNVNPGLSRRFKIEDAFNFEDFSDAELLDILNLKLKEQDLDATDPAKLVAIEILNRGKNRPNFGNAGEVENLITQAKTRCIARRAALPISEKSIDIIFEPEDFDPDCNRGKAASINLVKLFEDVIGYDEIIERLHNYQKVARTCKTRNLDPQEQIPTNFVFTGPPGTGKTTVARKMGQVFYDMGMLASVEVIECSASDLVGQYVGQTGPKTKKLFEKALGKVLFIDEAYRLSDGHFAQEAIDELVGLLTHPNYKSKLIVILAGYEQDMNRLMSVNTGLSSRFPDQIFFHNMDAEHCLRVVTKELQKKNIKIDGLDDESSAIYKEMREMIRDLSELKDWGNARDMMTLSKDMINLALRKDENRNAALELSADDALDALKKMLADRQRRSKIPLKARRVHELPEQSLTPDPPAPPAMDTSAAANTPPPSSSVSQEESRASTPNPQPTRGRGRGGPRGRGVVRGRGRGGAPPRNDSPRTRQNEQTQDSSQHDVERDVGVSDAVWHQLTAAKRVAEVVERNAKKAIETLEQTVKAEKNKEERQNKIVDDLGKAEATERDAARRSELQRLREEARLKEHAARLAREKAAAEARKKREAEQRRKEQEEKAQRKLREMGVCPVGYRWIRMGSYYRCAGGSHTVTLEQLDLQ